LFCSFCGDSLAVSEALICRSCGLLYCHFCRRSLEPTPNEHFLGENNHSLIPKDSIADCRCENGDIQSLEELRGYLIQDFLNYKHRIQVIANEPVEYFQMLLTLREKLISIGKQFILLPDQFAFQKDPLSTFSMAEQFALEHLQDISHNIRTLYDKLLTNKEQLVDPDELRQVNLKLSILAGKIEKFEQGFQSYFYSLLEDKKNHEEILEQFFSFFDLLNHNFHNIRKMLDEDERVFYISDPLASNLTGVVSRNVQLLITEKKIIFFQQPILKIKRKVKILKTVTGFELTGLLQKARKFRNSSLIIKVNKEEIELSGNQTHINILEKIIKLVIENIRIPTPKEWKHWQIGRIWSSDGYYANIDALLRWELRTGHRKSTSSSHPTYDQFEIPGSMDNLEQQTQIIEYIDKQMEKLSSRIRVIEYIINDLKSRKNTMSVNEFFSLYEQFSLKLKELEAERNSLLSHYSKGVNKTQVYC
jgi:hypothetical protein